MENKMINCTNISDDKIQKIISDYTSVGWEYVGISDGFPPNMSWIHLKWTKSEPPTLPDTKSSS